MAENNRGGAQKTIDFLAKVCYNENIGHLLAFLLYNECMQQKFLKFCDDFKLAMTGLVLATKKRSFWVVFIPVFVVFGTLVSLLSSGTSALDLFFATDFGGKLGILGNGFLALFGKGRSFLDWLIVFSLSILQAALISLIVFVFRRRNKSQSDTIQNAGIAAGLALLGSGCPACGTTLITPIIASIFSSGSLAIAGALSGIMTTLAFLLIIWSLKKVGLETYVIIKDENWRKKRQKVEEK